MSQLPINGIHLKSPTSKQSRARTGVEGLDNILGGGLPAHHLYLLEGSPGTGKTTLGIQFLLEGLANGESGLYLALSETAEELRIVAASHGWSLDGLNVLELVSEEGLSPELEQSILYPAELELGETTRNVMAHVEELKPSRVVFDSLSEMRLLAQDPLKYRRQILALKHFFAKCGCTVLLLDDKTNTLGDLQLHSIAHGVISLDQSTTEYGPERRHLRIAKLRGIKFRGGDHDFNLDTGGIAVFPRLVAAEHQIDFKPTLVSTGNTTLDTVLGGGLTRGNNTLFSGPSGIGKTTTAISCVYAALQRGEKAAYYLFDEGLATLLYRAASLGMNLRPYIDSGQLQMSALDPAEVSPGHFASCARQAVEKDGVSIVVIDSLNAYLQAMPGGKFLLLQMHELLTFFNNQGISTILILGQHGLVGEVRSDVDLSYLSDAILLFRFFEARGSMLKAISVIKSRTSSHELTIREFRVVDGKGIQIGQALVDFDGILTGIPSYKGSSSLLSDSSVMNGV
ncbi:MAG TPA: ATPase domain-containing protein [Rhodocyclaceae bacterium]|nr:ATPase domain-containing protein [Rhodocyclaceae bacterium]